MPAISWNGYELDGSDTSFEVALPDVVRAREAVATLLGHPLWDASRGVTARSDLDGWAPHRWGSEREVQLSIAEAVTRMLTGELDEHALVLQVRPPISLEPELLEAVARHSDKREPHEPAYVLAQRPVALGDGEYLDPSVAIVLHSKREPARAGGSAEPLAAQLLRAPVEIDITLGPTFLFEYAVELVEAIAKVFPEAEVSGGRDCANGWTWGCTYAASLYPFVALRPDVPAQEVIARVFDSSLFQRPRLRGGYEKILWYRTKHLHAARDINFAGAGRFLLDYLEAPEAHGLVPAIEHFINQGDQATREQYVEFCCDVQASAMAPAAKRDLTLVYLCLPGPDELREAWATESLKAQVDLLRPLYVGAPEEGSRPAEESSPTLGQRVCWLGLDPRDATRATVWVRPTASLFAKAVLDRVLR
ncbi:MAG: hypothetical protein HY901_36660 [Deltaproteobacteria bacterium]|nr:hypothetical protein [Deltaproteobacteria bacterium]